MLTSIGFENKIYTLGASQAVSVADMTGVLSNVLGRPITYSHVDRQTFVAERTAEGLPAVVADFLAQWAEAIGAGEFAEVTGDLERILGRKPRDFADVLSEAYAPVLI